MLNNVLLYIRKNRFAFLLFGLLQHLYMGATGIDPDLYARVFWPLNMLILGITSVGVFNRTQPWARNLGWILLIGVFLVPIVYPLLDHSVAFSRFIGILYITYFCYIAWGIRDCLFRPRSMNNEIIFASAAGYFLIIEIAVFIMMSIYFGNPSAFSGVDGTSISTIYMDMVYFETITQSTVGFGDITPVAYNARLVSSLIAAIGQLYIVMLVGVIISRYAGQRDR